MESPEPWERSGSWAFQLALCLLGPLFFLSYAFTLISPLPSLFLHAGNSNLRQGRFWWFVALAIGVNLSFTIHGWAGSVSFAVLVALPSLILAEMLVHRRGPEAAIVSAFFAICAAIFAVFWIAASIRGLSLAAAFQESLTQLEGIAKEIGVYLLQQGKNDWHESTRAALEEVTVNPRGILLELPGIMACGLLLLCILPCLALIRWNPKGLSRRAGVSRDFLRKWKSPDWLVWPSIVCVALVLFEVPQFSIIARNCIKPLLLIYFFQGMSILSYFLDSLRLRGPFRIPIYFFGVVLLYPMAMSFGFFDLWLNFRSRKRPSSEEESES